MFIQGLEYLSSSMPGGVYWVCVSQSNCISWWSRKNYYFLL